MWLPEKRECEDKEKAVQIPRDGKPVASEWNMQKGEEQKLKSNEIWIKEIIQFETNVKCNFILKTINL